MQLAAASSSASGSLPSLPPLFLPDKMRDKTILLSLKEERGLGDISCCFKVAEILLQAGVLKDHILISAAAEPDHVALFNRRGFRVLKPEEADAIPNIALQVIVPECVMTDHAALLTKPYPTVSLTEYGFTPYEMSLIRVPEEGVYLFRSLGLNVKEGEMGIFIDPDLFAWGFSPESGQVEKRLSLLKELSPHLSSLILGNEGAMEEQIPKFTATSKLYACYCYEGTSLEGYLGALLDLNHGSPSRHLIIVIPGKAADEMLQERLRHGELEWEDQVESLTLHRVNALTLHVDTKEEFCHPRPNGYRLTLICGSLFYQRYGLILENLRKGGPCLGRSNLKRSHSCQ